jgi:hypothetical protein
MFMITSVKGKKVTSFGYYRKKKVLLGFFGFSMLYTLVVLWRRGFFWGVIGP